jgi:hypothetical protein
MKIIKRPETLTAIIGCLLLTLALFVQAETEMPKAQLPVLTTSAGQSPDVTVVNIVCEEAAVKFDYCDVPDAELISAGVGLAGKESSQGFHVEVHTDLDKYPTGTPYKTVIIAIGASLKGMGASGLTVNDEVNRLEKIIEHCQEKGIFIIGVHVGGRSKRGAPGSDNERMIDAVAPFADYLIVIKDSNKDGRFTHISQEKNIPMTEVEYALDLVEIFQQMFN